MKIQVTILLALSAVIVTGVPIGKDNEFTQEEQSALRKFRELVGPLPQPYMNTDAFLINWIRGSESTTGNVQIRQNGTHFTYTFAPGFDLQKAARNLEKSLVWRKENNIDGILSEDFADLKKEFPFDISRTDKNGRPVFLIEYSNWDVKKGAEASAADSARFLRYLDYMLESVAAKGRELQTSDYTYLVDVAGFDMATHACPKCLSLYEYFPRHFETHYPQMTKNYLNVNAPKEYDNVKSLITSNLSPATKKGYKAYDNNTEEWLKEVGQIISVDQIPQHYVEGTTTTTTTTTTTGKPSNVFPWVRTCAGCRVVDQ